jgi:hypothetical protein
MNHSNLVSQSIAELAIVLQYINSHLKDLYYEYLRLQFLGDTFNALFAIMEEMAEEVGDLVFEALVSTLLYCL